MGCFMPQRRFLKFSDVTPAVLAEDGVRAMVLDIDNTLEPYENPDPTEPVMAWFRELTALGIRFAFVSNNDRARVERFNRELGFPFYFKAKKPFPKNVRRAIIAMGVRPDEVALMGDQVFTDVWAAHAAGVRAYLVPPIKDKRDLLTRFKRLLERPILRRFERKQRKDVHT